MSAVTDRTCYEIYHDHFCQMIDLLHMFRLIEIEIYYERSDIPANLPSMIPWVRS